MPIPSFYLYGEPHRLVGDSFVHVESLDDRSRPSEWTIKPHAHPDLCHIFVIASGGGSMAADGRDIHFTAPCMLSIPATTVHGFAWLEESTGTVITMASRYVAELVRHDPSLTKTFATPAALPLDDREASTVAEIVGDLMRELGWSVPGHRAAVDAALLTLMVLAIRKAEATASPVARPGPYVTVVARLRERIEQRFRLREDVASHAAALGTSQTALRVACAKVASASPAQMLDQRAMLEAQRCLLYSNLSISEIAYSIGFADPAYFSRFFTRHAGVSPTRFRDRQEQ